MKQVPIRIAAVVGALAAVAWAGPARADEMVIKFPGQHPNYVFEAEPHALVDPFHDFAFGAGFRGTVVVVQNGFVKTINNLFGFKKSVPTPTQPGPSPLPAPQMFKSTGYGNAIQPVMPISMPARR